MPKRLRLTLLWLSIYLMIVSSATGFTYLCVWLLSLGWHPLAVVAIAPLVLLIPGFFIARFIETTIFKS